MCCNINNKFTETNYIIFVVIRNDDKYCWIDDH
jgi:hypothetical protein